MTDLNMGETLWAWVTQTADGSISLISTIMPGVGQMHMPLIGRSEKILRSPHIEAAARAHGMALGQKVWLRRYTMADEIGRDG